jgi:ribonuclease BN (tRNA processing enzyme)
MEVFFPGSSMTARKFMTELRELEPRAAVEINGVSVTPHVVEHASGSPAFALRIACDGKVLAYTGDTEWTEALIEVARAADLLIAEALTFERRIRFHLDYASLRANQERIGAKRVVLTHMGPDMLAHVGDVDEELAADGLMLEV